MKLPFARLFAALTLILTPAVTRARPEAHGKSLAVPYHQQSTVVWCWAATIAMVAEFLNKTPVSDCDVADRLDRANGGSGACCVQGRPSNSVCTHGRREAAMTEVMKWYFHLEPTVFHRALTWPELTSSIDSGFPVIAKLYMGGTTGHVVVITGYQPNGTVLVEDPWKDAPHNAAPRSYAQLINRKSRPVWIGTWYFNVDELSGHLSGVSSHAIPEPELASAGADTPARSTLSMHLLQPPDEPVRGYVDSQLQRHLSSARACYDMALASGAPIPSSATVRLSFVVAAGTPSWIMVKNGGGLPSPVTACVSDAVSKWSGLFPKEGTFAESQVLDLVFARLETATR